MEKIYYNSVKEFKKALKTNIKNIRTIQVISKDMVTGKISFSTEFGIHWEQHILNIDIKLQVSCFDGSFKKPNFMNWVDCIIMQGDLGGSNYHSLISLLNDSNIKGTYFKVHVCNNWDSLSEIGWNNHELFLNISGKMYLVDVFTGKEDCSSPFYR